MSDLPDLLRHLFSRFGRPPGVERLRATDANIEAVDTRLTVVEQRQRDIAVRLRLLEMTADPRGRRQHDG